ncbi:MAG: type VI secretion system Vgr family protein [Gemmatimonadaceae bacterium]
MPEITQDNRPFKATTPLGPNVLVPVGMTGTESVSRPFLFTVDFVSTDSAISASRLLGKGMTLQLELGSGEFRNIHGMVRRFSSLGSDRTLSRYRAELVPVLWFLTLSNDCRTFEKQTALQIIEKVCTDAGLTDFKQRVATQPPQLPYVVQYRESNFAFISRMLEAAGLYYMFEHEEGKHTLVFSDSQAGSIPAAEVDRAVVDSQFIAGQPPPDKVFRVTREFAVHAKSISLADHELLRADSVGSASSTSQDVRGERFDFLGDFGPNRSAAEAKLLIEVEEAERDIVRGESTCAFFQSGTRVKLTHGPFSAGGDEFHLLEVRHKVESGDVHAAAGLVHHYTNEFVGIPVATRYRPPRATSAPSVRGNQTAKIVGSGDAGSIDVDADGCVLLQFPWDRGFGKDGKSAHRVHVASVWSGTGWGFVQIPRVGQEVLVEYLEGDLERPLITGRVYNSSHKHPYALPGDKTQSGWKSRTLEGGSDNFNELRFEDKKGSEHVFLQAEKDLNSIVKNDETREVRHDRTTTIKNHDTRTVKEGNDKHTVSKGDQTVEVSQGKQTITVMGDQSLTVKSGNRSAKIEKGNESLEVSMGNMTVGVKMGNIGIKADLGAITIEAMQKIELKVGPMSSILIEPAGITLKGLNITSEAQVQSETKGLMTKLEGQVMTEVKGVITQVKGDGMLMAKGGITMIN